MAAARLILVVFAVAIFQFMLQLITILNRCYRLLGFVYLRARFSPDIKSIEIVVRLRKGSKAICLRCHQPAPRYYQLGERRFEFIPCRGFLVSLLCSIQRVDCRRQLLAVEEVSSADGRLWQTGSLQTYMLFLARHSLTWRLTVKFIFKYRS